MCNNSGTERAEQKFLESWRNDFRREGGDFYMDETKLQ